jgi:hypothetical protein
LSVAAVMGRKRSNKLQVDFSVITLDRD